MWPLPAHDMRRKKLLTACQQDYILLNMPIAPDDLTRKVTVRISDDLFKRLGHYCVDEDKSANQVITELLEKLLLSEGKKVKR